MHERSPGLVLFLEPVRQAFSPDEVDEIEVQVMESVMQLQRLLAARLLLGQHRLHGIGQFLRSRLVLLALRHLAIVHLRGLRCGGRAFGSALLCERIRAHGPQVHQTRLRDSILPPSGDRRGSAFAQPCDCVRPAQSVNDLICIHGEILGTAKYLCQGMPSFCRVRMA